MGISFYEVIQKEDSAMKKKIIVLSLILTGITGSFFLPEKGYSQMAPEASSISTETISRDADVTSELPASAIFSAEEIEAVRQQWLDQRDLIDSMVDSNPASPAGLPLKKGREVNVIDPSIMEAPSTFTVSRNNKNTIANGAAGSVLAEPAAASEGMEVFYAGNNYASYSTDGGATWVNVPIPAGPADALVPCCDNDVVHDKGHGETFWSTLYLNAARTNGVIRIYVRPTIPGATACSYTIDPGGTADNVVPDYPHLGLSNNYLYLTTNNLTTGTTWLNSQVRRFNLDTIITCPASITPTVATYNGTIGTTTIGQRVFVPVDGARETMYWGALDNTTTFRIFSWPESSVLTSTTTRAIAASTFANPDCRGGTNNTDFVEKSTAWSITGFRMRGAVGGGNLAFYWNVGPDAAHTQGHVHSAVFREYGLTLISQPHIFNNTLCFAFPTVAANDRGDFGLTIAYGGRLGGGGPAVTGGIAIDDSYTTGVGSFTSVLAATAGMTHNPPGPDFRYGDYLTIRPQHPCGLYFAATSYSLNGGTAVANVNARYVEFGRERYKKCSDGWRDEIRIP